MVRGKSIILILVILITFSFYGCSKKIRTDETDVVAKITNEQYTPTWVQPIICGKVTTVVTHPATYEIDLEYNGSKYCITDEDTYNTYSKDVGQTVNAKLKTDYYDNGTTKNDIVSINNIN